MGIPLTRQLYAMLYALLCGIICGGIYDLFRLLRVFLGVSRYSMTERKLYGRKFPLIGYIQPTNTGNFVRIAAFWVVFLGDVLYAGLIGCIFSVFLYVAASGCFRWFYLFFACVGFFVYYFTIGKIVMAFSDVLISLFQIGFQYALYFLMVPFRIAVKLLRAFLHIVSVRLIAPIRASAYMTRCRRYTHQVKSTLNSLVRI